MPAALELLKNLPCQALLFARWEQFRWGMIEEKILLDSIHLLTLEALKNCTT